MKELGELIDELQELADKKGRDCDVNGVGNEYDTFLVIGDDKDVYESINL